MAGDLTPFHKTIWFGELGHSPLAIELVATSDECGAISADLGLIELSQLQARLNVRSWLDGAEITGQLTALVTQECGVTLDPFESTIEGEVLLRVVPKGSPNAPKEAGEIELDPDADDPPDELEGSQIDLGAVVIEHLVLSLDPFPRKPGAEFEPPASDPVESPFAVLRALKGER